MRPIKIVNKIGSISDFFIDDDFYNFILNHLNLTNIFVFGDKFMDSMCDLYTKHLNKDYSIKIDNLPSFLTCYD